jgi:hypothetical protein
VNRWMQTLSISELSAVKTRVSLCLSTPQLTAPGNLRCKRCNTDICIKSNHVPLDLDELDFVIITLSASSDHSSIVHRLIFHVAQIFQHDGFSVRTRSRSLLHHHPHLTALACTVEPTLAYNKLRCCTLHYSICKLSRPDCCLDTSTRQQSLQTS